MRFFDFSTPSQPFTEEQCTLELANILETSPKVATLLQAIFALNKDGLRRGITCRQVVRRDKGSVSDGILRWTVQKLEETLVHELVHAFDKIRTGKFSSICHLVACGEVRASALGQCSNIRSAGEKRACIWNDAVRSTAVHCGGEVEASAIVRQVFDRCVKDTAPFITTTPRHQ
ncbi:peptidase M76 [Dichotomocladium elegans]|nr:peptidase M76 [Dichotomocladium elegans]